jgi:hypothetical protein
MELVAAFGNVRVELFLSITLDLVLIDYVDL